MLAWLSLCPYLDIRTARKYSRAMIKSKANSFDALNPAQRRAATFGTAVAGQRASAAGPLLIIAGAGTGKTNTLAHRVAHLV